MNKRIFLIAVHILLSLVLSGCWDYIEYEDMAQVVGIGVDYNAESEQSTITIQYQPIKKGRSGMSNSSQGRESQGIVHSATDKTFLGALAKIQEIAPKRLFFGYTQVLLVGEEAAKHNIMEVIDLLDRSPALVSTSSIAVTAGKAEDVLKTADPADIMPSAPAIYKLIHLSPNTGVAYPVTVNKFTEMLAIGGWEAVAPRVVSVEAKSQQQDTKGKTQAKTPTAQDETPANVTFNGEHTGAYTVTGMAAFKGDKFVGWLDEKESMGLNWIMGKKMLNYKFSETSDQAGPGDALYFHVLESKGKIKVQLDSGQPVIYVNVAVKAALRKYYQGEGPDFISAAEVSAEEQGLADSVRSDIEAALQKGQKELQTDIFGFGFALFRESPRLWKSEYEAKWADIYPAIPVKINVEAKVINTGANIKKLIIK
ncbi:MAG TPA: Ger(x)C family spore germination protein [Methylomusa anaerophila]|uniref:Spore germination protein B3 n=1 Tax=Methylomusa anaerophila TaxID=1930071 RepID=A0A348AK86_9FIRM|nr:Ger(x)C family spore germination protein [Methylomusa anaerophila]BBB91484.1 spore germination protein B3 precursor [Methylomusa anaerophila]HML89927.1 Ger(x)C family spore germination protein [Methylomusa anaerophila]